MASRETTTVEVDGLSVSVSNPSKVFFPALGLTKMDLIEHYLGVGPGVLRGVVSRPVVLKRYPDGVEGKHFYQKRIPDRRPDWLRTVRVAFPSGRTADELCPADLAHVVWAVNLGCIDLHPWAIRRWDLEHPDELRVDLDPMPGVPFNAVRTVALAVRDVLGEHGLVGWPRTSGSHGMHVVVRIMSRWGFTEVRRAALALAREVERRHPALATSRWWREERGERVLIDFNQNARDRTVASAYSVRPNPEALVAAPVTWDEVPDVELADFTIANMAARWAAVGDLEVGDPSNGVPGIDDRAGSLDGLLGLADRDEQEGLGDAPWPPNFPRAAAEPRRVAPSRRRADG
jgi:DNA ligase D-like protein (predicted polymerase)